MKFEMNDEAKKRTAKILGGILGMTVGGAVGYGLGDALTPDHADTGADDISLDSNIDGPHFVDGRTGEEIDPSTLDGGTFRVHFADGTSTIVQSSPQNLGSEHGTLAPPEFHNPEDESLFEGQESNHNGVLDMPFASPRAEQIFDSNSSAYVTMGEEVMKDVLYYEYLPDGFVDSSGELNYLGEAYGEAFKDRGE
ncbi:MAG: hypothetical protein ACRC9L_04800 [Brevinema sp.]